MSMLPSPCPSKLAELITQRNKNVYNRPSASKWWRQPLWLRDDWLRSIARKELARNLALRRLAGLHLPDLKPAQVDRIRECGAKNCYRVFWAANRRQKTCDRHKGKTAGLRMERKRRRDGIQPRPRTWGNKRKSRYALELLDYRILIEISHGYRKVDTIAARPEILSLIGWVTPPKKETWADLTFDERVEAKRALVAKRLKFLEKDGCLKKTSRTGYDLTDGGVYACDEARRCLSEAGRFRGPKWGY